MSNMLCALHKAGFMREDAEKQKKPKEQPFLYKSLDSIPSPLSLEAVKGYSAIKAEAGSYRIIEEDSVLLKTLQEAILGNTKPFTMELKGVYYVGEYKKITDWLVKNKKHVRVLQSKYCLNPVYAQLVYSATKAQFSVEIVNGGSEYRKKLAKYWVGSNTVEYILEFLEKAKESWEFIPLVVDKEVLPVKVYENGHSHNSYLGANLLSMESFEKEYKSWLDQGFRVKKDVWYICCKSKKVGNYLKRNLELSPKSEF